MTKLNRREFVQRSGAVLLTTSLFGGRTGRLQAKAMAVKGVRLGGPVFLQTDDPAELARHHRELGYRAAYCPKVSLNEPDRIRAIERAYAREDIVIAEVGRWVNLLDHDPTRRAANMRQVTEGLALADEVGALCCVDIAGSYNREIWYGPAPKNLSREFFDEVVENARKIIDTVKPKRARFCYEMMGWALPDGPESYVELIQAIDRPAFAVHLDPCNLINSPRRFYDNRQLINACFDQLGQWIVSCHAKDLTWDVEMNIHFREVRPGLGSLDYETYLRRLAELPQRAPLMLEHLPNAQEYDEARKYLLEFGKQKGIAFSGATAD